MLNTGQIWWGLGQGDALVYSITVRGLCVRACVCVCVCVCGSDPSFPPLSLLHAQKCRRRSSTATDSGAASRATPKGRRQHAQTAANVRVCARVCEYWSNQRQHAQTAVRAGFEPATGGVRFCAFGRLGRDKIVYMKCS